MCFVGLAGRILLPETAVAENIFFELIALLFSPLVSGILLAAVLSAIMSTADSMLLVAASSLSIDLGLSRHFPSKQLLASMATGFTLAVGLYLAPDAPGQIFERLLPFSAALAVLWLSRVRGAQPGPSQATSRPSALT
ncbi:sodium:solute symporter family transporter [Haliea atlantica]